MPTKRESHPRRQRPAVFWAILELATLADQWLDIRGAASVPGCRGQIMTELRRALTALSDASAGRQTLKQLSRVRVAIDHCEVAFWMLHERSPTIAKEAFRRLEQILSSLDILERIEPAEWLNADLAHSTIAESDPSKGNGSTSRSVDREETVAPYATQTTTEASQPDAPARDTESPDPPGGDVDGPIPPEDS